MSGVERIAAERQRQIEREGFTLEHDDEHVGDEMALAAACYSMPESMRSNTILGRSLRRILWPWGQGWWKPSGANRVRELTKAGALIAAEIDRLERAGTPDAGEEQE